MVFIVWATESKISHVFTELEHVLEHITSGSRHHRVEIWNKDKLKGLHVYA